MRIKAAIMKARALSELYNRLFVVVRIWYGYEAESWSPAIPEQEIVATFAPSSAQSD